MSGDRYRPIPCALYSRYELAVLRHVHVHLTVAWRDDEGTHLERLEPLDLETRDGAEYLLARPVAGGTLRRLRLDRNLRAEPLPER